MKTLSSSVESPRQRRRLQEDKSKEALSSTPSSPSSSSFTKEKRKKRRGIRFIAIVNSPRACHQHQQHQHQRLRSLSFTAFYASLLENNKEQGFKRFRLIVSSFSFVLRFFLIFFCFKTLGREAPKKIKMTVTLNGSLFEKKTKPVHFSPNCTKPVHFD